MVSEEKCTQKEGSSRGGSSASPNMTNECLNHGNEEVGILDLEKVVASTGLPKYDDINSKQDRYRKTKSKQGGKRRKLRSGSKSESGSKLETMSNVGISRSTSSKGKSLHRNVSR